MNATHAARNGSTRNGFIHHFGSRLWRLALVAALVLGAGLLVAARPLHGVEASSGFSTGLTLTQSTAGNGFVNVVESTVKASARAQSYWSNAKVDFGDGTVVDAQRDWGGCADAGCPTLYASHTYGRPGTFTVTISYDDTAGSTDSINGSVTIQPSSVTFTFNFKGSGSGRVSYYWLGSSNDAPVWLWDGSTGSGSCAVTCSVTLKAGTMVTFTAHSAAGSSFGGWANDLANVCPASARNHCGGYYQVPDGSSGTTWTLFVPQVSASSGQPFTQNLYLTFKK
jgi:hypothetical protein